MVPSMKENITKINGMVCVTVAVVYLNQVPLIYWSFYFLIQVEEHIIIQMGVDMKENIKLIDLMELEDK